MGLLGVVLGVFVGLALLLIIFAVVKVVFPILAVAVVAWFLYRFVWPLVNARGVN